MASDIQSIFQSNKLRVKYVLKFGVWVINMPRSPRKRHLRSNNFAVDFHPHQLQKAVMQCHLDHESCTQCPLDHESCM
jgi:hypothetical protein